MKYKFRIVFLAVLCIFFFVNSTIPCQQTQWKGETEEEDIEFVTPTKEGFITSGFGWRMNPFTGEREFHKGIDIAARKGTKVYAAAEGKVVSAVSDHEKDSFYGKYMLILHSNGMKTLYSKLDSLLVQKSQTVKAGELIGRVGSTGRARGPHLHFEILVNDTAQNPSKYIDFKFKCAMLSMYRCYNRSRYLPCGLC